MKNKLETLERLALLCNGFIRSACLLDQVNADEAQTLESLRWELAARMTHTTKHLAEYKTSGAREKLSWSKDSVAELGGVVLLLLATLEDEIETTEKEVAL